MKYLEVLKLYQNRINELKPYEGELLEQIKSYYRIALTWTTNALEGNSLTEIETKVLIEDRITIGGKTLRDIFEAVNHAEAYDYMFTLLDGREITENNILQLHKLLHHNTDKEFAGRYRDISVFISGSKYPVTKVENIQEEMNQLCLWIKSQRSDYHTVEFAALLHKKFVFILPFKKGNGQIARLLMNTVLIQDGFLPALILPCLRKEYIILLEKAHKCDLDFIEFIARREIESQKELIKITSNTVVR